MLARKAVAVYRSSRHSAAVTLQRCFRGYTARYQRAQAAVQRETDRRQVHHHDDIPTEIDVTLWPLVHYNYAICGFLNVYTFEVCVENLPPLIASYLCVCHCTYVCAGLATSTSIRRRLVKKL
jgi:hypothetical protein